MLGAICRVLIYGGLGGVFLTAGISLVVKMIHIIVSVF